MSSKRASTIRSYKDIWERHLKPHLGDIRMGEYRPSQATELLTKASGKLGRNSVNHIRGLMSGIFSHATALGRIEHNPIRDAKSLVRAKAPAATPYYSLDELENIITALADDPEAQLMMALAGFLGLRPSEICGLRFEDFTENAVHIRRAVTSGVEGPTKTEGSVGSLPLIDVVRIPLSLWRLKLGSPDSGWVFPNTHGDPINLKDFYVKRIRTKLKTGQWKGLYAGRRTAATLLTQLTGNPMAAAQLLRHQDYSLTMRAYAKQDRKELSSGLKLLESSLRK
jgi:integrase